MGDRRWSSSFKEEDWGLDERLAMTSSPLRADSKAPESTTTKAELSFATTQAGTSAAARRTSRRSSDVLNATKLLDDEQRIQRNFDTIRETKCAMVTTDDIGAVASVNEYMILRDLGKGSFAEVKLCKKTLAGSGSSSGSMDEKADDKMASPTEEDDRELYAIKIFSKSLLLKRRSFQRTGEGRMAMTTDMDKVQREIAIMKKLIHPNLVRLYEVIDDGAQDALYIVLEYVTGGAIMEYDLEDRKYVYRKSRRGIMSEMHAARCIVDVMAGLVYLHLHHICHRDLKPENVLVDSRGRCKIADFGVAHYFEEEESKGPKQLHELYRSHSRGLLKQTDGTWCFWAPEMCRAGGPFSGYSCDIWAAGVCLWVFMYGTLPFMEDSPDDLFDMIVAGDLQFPERDVSPDLVDLLEQLLRKNPDDRITLEDALDHSWCQLADEEGNNMDMSASTNSTHGGSQLGGGEDQGGGHQTLGKSLRARATSFSRVYVTQEDINSAIRSVNNFVLVTKLKKRLTQKLQEARASLSRRSPTFTTPDGSRSNTPVTGGSANTHSRATTPLQGIYEVARSLSGSPSRSPSTKMMSPPSQQVGGGRQQQAAVGAGEAEMDMSSSDAGGTPYSRTSTPTTGGSGRSRAGLRKRQSCSIM